MKKLFLLFAALGVAISVAAKVTLPDILSDDMVLQQRSMVNLWGWADAQAAVKIETSWGVKATVKSDSDGRWTVQIQTPAGSYVPQRITFTSGEKVTLNNVLIGEVWFASGQSNMDMPLGGYWNGFVEGANEVIASADAQRDRIRFVKVPYAQAYAPKERAEGRWNSLSTATAVNMSAAAYFFAEQLNRALDVPVGMIVSAWGGSRIECWIGREALAGYADVDLSETAYNAEKELHMRPMAMYNAMVSPLAPYTLKGFLWYQGESNIGHHAEYAQRMADLAAAWRKLWGGEERPFYFVEIAPYGYQNNLSAPLREAQFQAQQLIPGSGMVCTNDLVTPSEVGNIHPANKRDVGRRLAFWALNRTCGKPQVACGGMQFRSMVVTDGRAVLSFDNSENGFGRLHDLRGFEICGADRVFHPAQATAEGNERLVVWSPEVPAPVAVRYGFGDFVPGNVINSRGLPLIPFRTDTL